MRAIVRLGMPLIAVQVGMMLMSMVDAMMVGQLNPESLAAVALGHLYLWGVSIMAIGLLLALDPVISQAAGAGDTEGIARAIQRGVIVAVIVAVVVALARVPVGYVLRFAGQPAELIPIVETYVWITIGAVLPFFLFVTMRQALQAMQHVAAIFIAVVVANLANVFVNWLLIYGNGGFPALGVAGSAWATVLCRWIMLSIVLVVGWRHLGPLLRPRRAGVFALKPIVRMIRVGLPIGGTMMIEFAAFALSVMLMGMTMGARTLAAHEVSLTLAALAFMMPLGVGQAASVLVGQAVGAGDHARTRSTALTSLLMGGGVMTITAIVFITMPGPLARLFTNDAQTLAIAVMLIPIAGFFQVFDGLQVVASGVLRGLGETNAPMRAMFIGKWFIGVPLGITLVYRFDFGVAGFWWGFVAGLGSVALLLCTQVYLRVRTATDRLVIDDAPQPPEAPPEAEPEPVRATD